MPKQIVVKIAPDGRIEAVTRGIKGQACISYIAVLEELLDARTVDSAYTKEYEQNEIGEQNSQTEEISPVVVTSSER